MVLRSIFNNVLKRVVLSPHRTYIIIQVQCHTGLAEPRHMSFWILPKNSLAPNLPQQKRAPTLGPGYFRAGTTILPVRVRRTSTSSNFLQVINTREFLVKLCPNQSDQWLCVLNFSNTKFFCLCHHFVASSTVKIKNSDGKINHFSCVTKRDYTQQHVYNSANKADQP